MGLTNFCFITAYALHKPIFRKSTSSEDKSFVCFTGAIPQYTRRGEINGAPQPIPDSIKVRFIAFGEVGKKLIRIVNTGSLLNIKGNIVAFNFVNKETARKDFYNIVNIKEFDVLNKENEEHRNNRYLEDIQEYLKEQKTKKLQKEKGKSEK